MNMKHIVAALALSLSVATTHSQAAEVSSDLGANIQQVIAEIHVGSTDWNKTVIRIDQLIAEIDQQISDGVGDQEELANSRLRLVNAREKIFQQHLTVASYPFEGELPIDPNDDQSGDGEVLVGTHHGGGGYGGSGSGSYSSRVGSRTGGSGGGGGGGGGLGGIGLLGGIAAAIATAIDDDNGPGVIASPSN